MARANSAASEATFFNLGHAKWAVRVLGMVIAVVGRESLIGLILRQTLSEINSIVKDEQPNAKAAQAACYKNN